MEIMDLVLMCKRWRYSGSQRFVETQHYMDLCSHRLQTMALL